MRRTLITAIILFGLDAFWLNQGIIALITVMIVLPAMLIKALMSWKNKHILKKRLTACGIYFLMSLFIFASISLNNKIARSRADMLIETCEKYKDKNSEYPENLSDLVPDFINEIPVAKYTLNSNRFYYTSSKYSHSLFYLAMPPFGRPTYSFEKKKWTYID
jgi:predicted PurR-regulated permease PerM